MPVVRLAERPAGTRFDAVVVPVASIEHHGVLPVGSDVVIASCFVDRLLSRSGRVAARVGVAPVIPYSPAMEHEAMGSTVSVGATVFIDYLASVIQGFFGFTGRVLVAVFHGGAYSASHVAARLVRRRRPTARVVVYSFWDSVAKTLASMGVKSYPIHADPVEASLLLACGVKTGVREAAEAEVVQEARMRSEKLRSLLLPPWIGEDSPQLLYPSKEVAANRRLGDLLLNNAVEDLLALISVVAG